MGIDADDKYFHPIIKIEDDIIIKGQGDIDINKRRVFMHGDCK